MTESQARKIFDLKLPLCDVLGLDVRTECIEAGVPSEWIEKFMRADEALENATTALLDDPTLLTVGGAADTGRPGRLAPEAGLGFICLNQASTGLPMIVWVMAKVDSRRAPYLRAQANHSSRPEIKTAVDLAIEGHSRSVPGTAMSDADLRLATGFIRRNLEVLLDYWNGAIGSYQLLKRITR